MKLRSLLLIALVAVVFCGCHSYQPTSITVASYNLRNANGSDSAKGNGWGQRYPVIAKMVQYHDFDIFGTQECFIHQLKDMKEALPGYDYIGVGRDDGKEKGEHSAIFYRTDKFDVIEKGDFWLSETPDVPSKGWDAVLPRICSWGHFKCKDTGFEFLFFNLHMDHIGKKARVESAYLVQDKMKELISLMTLLSAKVCFATLMKSVTSAMQPTEHSMISIRTVSRKAASTMYSSLLFSK